MRRRRKTLANDIRLLVLSLQQSQGVNRVSSSTRLSIFFPLRLQQEETSQSSRRNRCFLYCYDWKLKSSLEINHLVEKQSDKYMAQRAHFEEVMHVI